MFAKGGMGSVWRARHILLDTDLAIKLMDPAIATSPPERARFAAEANPRFPTAILRTWTALLLGAVLWVGEPQSAAAFEGNGGVGIGGVLAGARPHLAVSPHASIGVRFESGLILSAEDTLGILLANNKDGLGVHDRLAALAGYTSGDWGVQIGPSVSFFSMPVCNAVAWCGRVSGISMGVHAQASYYFLGPLGLSLSGSGDWIAGGNLLLPSGFTGTVAIGPVVRWAVR